MADQLSRLRIENTVRTSLTFWVAILGVLGIFSCKTDIDIYAPPQDIWVVYGVLNLTDSIQYIRVSKAFQVEGDALAFAAETDLTVNNLHVELAGPDGIIQATQIDTVLRDSGLFFPGQSIYQLRTDRGNQLRSNEVYELSITADSLPGFLLEARTRIPSIPVIQRPPGGVINDTIACLSSWNIEDSLEIIFSTRRPGGPSSGAYAFQVQADLDYDEDGERRSAVFGPSKPFTDSRGCAARSNDTRCFYIPKGVVLDAFEQVLIPSGGTYTYAGDKRCMPDPEDLPRPVRVRVSAVDTMMGRYLVANDPRFTNFNTVRTEFSNITGTARTVGIFGSTATAERAVVLSSCAERRLFLNGQRPRPGDCD